MNSSPSPYLNVTRLQSTQRGISNTSSCSTFTHSTGPMPSGNTNVSGSENGSVVYQPRSRSQMIGGFKHSSIVVHTENVGANAKPSTSRSAPSRTPMSSISREQVIGRIASKHVGHPGLDPDAHKRELPALGPRIGHCELRRTQHDSRLRVRPFGVWFRQVHRHVEVVASGLERGVENRWVEPRVARVDDRIDRFGTRERDDRGLIGRVECSSLEPRIVTSLDGDLGTRRVEIGDDDSRQDVRFGRSTRNRRTDTTRAHH